MFLFKSFKKLDHKQCSMIGFVLAVMSILVTAIVGYGAPLLVGTLQAAGLFHLEIFVWGLALVIFFSSQGLLLFGFPLYYVHDKKSHMTGFQILLYALMWIVLTSAVIFLVSGLLFHTEPVALQELTY